MFLSVVHLRELKCSMCEAILAVAGARSFIVDDKGDPLAFSQDEPPEALAVQFVCRNGHVTELNVPDEIGAEESLLTPDEAPIAADARAVRP